MPDRLLTLAQFSSRVLTFLDTPATVTLRWGRLAGARLGLLRSCVPANDVEVNALDAMLP